MGPAEPENSMLIPVVAGRRILLGSDSGLLLLSELLFCSVAKRLHAIDRARHPPNLRCDLSTTNETDHDAGADNEGKNESVLAV